MYDKIRAWLILFLYKNTLMVLQKLLTYHQYQFRNISSYLNEDSRWVSAIADDNKSIDKALLIISQRLSNINK